MAGIAPRKIARRDRDEGSMLTPGRTTGQDGPDSAGGDCGGWWCEEVQRPRVNGKAAEGYRGHVGALVATGNLRLDDTGGTGEGGHLDSAFMTGRTMGDYYAQLCLQCAAIRGVLAEDQEKCCSGRSKRVRQRWKSVIPEPCAANL